jgi:hypothetical protein
MVKPARHEQNKIKIEIVEIRDNGMRLRVKRGDEMRGNDDIYDPWLRIPKNEVRAISHSMMVMYKSGQIPKLIQLLNDGGLNHINRTFFDAILDHTSSDDTSKFANIIYDNCSNKVNILFLQMYSHRLFKNDEYKQLLIKSIKLARNMPHPSWDKWVASGYFWLARYSADNDIKAKYCVATILEPREIISFSPHMKFWKLFRAAAWLVANKINTKEARAAIVRFKSLQFYGYNENGYEYRVAGYLENPSKCQSIMHNDANPTTPNSTAANP